MDSHILNELVGRNIIPQYSADCLELRRKILIDKFVTEFKGKRVLELGAQIGYFTSFIAEHAKKVTVVEIDPINVKVLKLQFKKSVKIIQGDAFEVTQKMRPGSFDTVVFAGLLNHFSNPFSVLETIAALKPKKILIDSMVPQNQEAISVWFQDQETFQTDEPSKPQTRAIIRLGEAVIDKAMTNLGYVHSKTIEKKNVKIAKKQDSSYFQDWKIGYSKWWSLSS